MGDQLFTGYPSTFEAECAELRAENAALRARVEALEAALRFYADGTWPEDYPGGVLYAEEGDEHANCLDYGDQARAALQQEATTAPHRPDNG
jgi:hypothetical protein